MLLVPQKVVALLSAHEPVAVPRAVAVAVAVAVSWAVPLAAPRGVLLVVHVAASQAIAKSISQDKIVLHAKRSQKLMDFIVFILIVPFITTEHHQPTHAPMSK